MRYFLELALSGLSIGAIYGLIAMAYAVVYRATGLVNFAQGEIGMLTAYVSWTIATTFDINLWSTLVVALAVGACTGLILERFVMRPMLGEPLFSGVLVTVGVAVMLRSGVMLFWDPTPQRLQAAGTGDMLLIGDVSMRTSQLGVIIALLAATVAFWTFFAHSRYGIAMRAAASDERTARLMGISTARVQAVAWAASSALAGLAGIFFAAIYNLSPTLFALGLKAFPATVLGGFDSIIGSGIAGLFIGVYENMIGGYVSSTFKDIAGFMLIIVVLMVRPFGLFGEKKIERV